MVKDIIYLFIFLNLIMIQKTFSQTDYTQFEGKKGSISFFKKYEFSNVHDYNINTPGRDSTLTKILKGSYPEARISQKFSSKFLKNTKDSIIFSIALRTRLIIESHGKKHSLISYLTSDKTTANIIDYIFEKSWKENSTTDIEIDFIKTILENADANIIFKFYNDSDNSKYPEINKLKPLVKNENGDLDIEKLARVIKENKSVLSKYLD